MERNQQQQLRMRVIPQNSKLGWGKRLKGKGKRFFLSLFSFPKTRQVLAVTELLDAIAPQIFHQVH